MRGLLATALLGLALPTAPAEAAERVRWVLAAGAHQGGAGREPLRHAVDDAMAFVDTMTELGGVDRGHVMLLADPTAPGIVAQLEKLRLLLREGRARGERAEVFVYYSGHADERGLLPGGQLLPWSELRQAVEELDADVRVAVIDACASGALLRQKGGTTAAGFLASHRDVVAGEAWITSSSDSEASQESDRIGASYFTYHLVAGLRGAADEDGDRVISLEEAYDHAYDETVRGTERTWVGAQHPTYEFDLTGHGDVVVTDLRDRSAELVLDSALDGEVSVRDAGGRLVAELTKRVGSPLRYALAPGRYTVRLRARGTQYRSEVTVSRTAPTTLTASLLVKEGDLEASRTRGGAPVTWSVTHPANVSLVPFVSTYGWRTDARLRGVGANVLGTVQAKIEGVDLGAWSASKELVGADLQAGVSWVDGRSVGFQLGGVLTRASHLAGAQWGLANVVAGDADGAQVGAVNWVGGAQRGLQWGVVNVTRGRSAEGQLGWQLGVYNRAAVGQKGVQIGAINDSERLQGTQLGLVNVAGEVRGAQVGLVNVARRLDGEAFGLLNVIGNGYHAFETWTDEVATVHVGVKAGSRHLYGLFDLGFDPTTAPVAFTYGLGMGAHGDVKRLGIDGDFTALTEERPASSAFTSIPGSMLLRTRLSLSVALGKGVDLFAGPSGTVAMRTRRTSPAFPDSPTFLPSWTVPGATASFDLRWWLGYQAGLRVRF